MMDNMKKCVKKYHRHGLLIFALLYIFVSVCFPNLLVRVVVDDYSANGRVTFSITNFCIRPINYNLPEIAYLESENGDGQWDIVKKKNNSMELHVGVGATLWPFETVRQTIEGYDTFSSGKTYRIAVCISPAGKQNWFYDEFKLK